MKSISRFFSVLFLYFLFYPVSVYSQVNWQNIKAWVYNEQKFPDSTVGAQYIVPADHWVYKAIRILALETGTVSLVNKSPISVGELERFFSVLQYEGLSPYGKELYSKTQKWFTAVPAKKEGLPVEIALTPSFAFAAFYRNTGDIYPEFDYRDIPGFFNMPASVSVQNYVHLYYDFALFQQFGFANSQWNFINIPFNLSENDTTLSRKSHLSVGFPIRDRYFWNFKIGRGGLNIGDTATPSIALSDRMETATYAQLTLFGSNVRYGMNVTQLAVNKYLYYHTIDFRLFKRLSISATEGVMVNAPLELTYLNPVELFHGLEPWSSYKDYNRDMSSTAYPEDGRSRVGTLLVLSAELNPWKYTRFYVLFQMNQFQLASEIKNTPNAIGWQGGFDAVIPAKNGYWLANIEGLWTSPYMYKLENKNWSFCMNRRGYYGSGQFQWTGTPFGPDTIMTQISGGFISPGLWECNIFYRFLVQGAMHNNTAVNKNGFWTTFPGKNEAGEEDKNTEKALRMAAIKTPSGIPQYTHRIGIEGVYNPNRHFTFKGYTGFAYRINNKNLYNNSIFGFESALSCEFFIFGGKKTIIQ